MNASSKPCFLTKRCSDLSDFQIKQCSNLYSTNYGEYSGLDSHRISTPIKLGVNYYNKYRKCTDMYVSLCYVKRTLLGQAFFLKKELNDGKICIWVTQLVVRKDYRRKGIATKLLQSAWGFSDYFAWGLATTNAVTIKTLESVTWRNVTPDVISKNIDIISTLCNNIEFVKDSEIKLSTNCSQINSHFFPNFQMLDNGLEEIYAAKLGKINDGYEWLAFTFQTQEMIFNQSNFDKLLDFSIEQIQDAYGRMKLSQQKWTSATSHEVDVVLKECSPASDAHILDLGCGIGRHSIELCKRGYNVTGVDFSHMLIKKAKSRAKSRKKIHFFEQDCRNLKLARRYDVILCLYDVIGTFRDSKQNRRIAENIYKQLKTGGKAVISVMNMELTQKIAKHKIVVKDEPIALLKLPASDIMQASGNIFNPDYYILDESTNLVYRKEQFDKDGFLSSEYIIADYRFTRTEILNMLSQIGFNIIASRYVRLNHWEEALSSTDNRAKELLIIVEKP